MPAIAGSIDSGMYASARPEVSPSQAILEAVDALLHSLASPAREAGILGYRALSSATLAYGARKLPTGDWFQLADLLFPSSRSLTPAEAEAYRTFRKARFRPI